MPKKICFISPKAYPLFNPKAKTVVFGGAEVQFYLLATELAKKSNFEVCMIVADCCQKKVEEYKKVFVYKSYRLADNFFNKAFKFLKTLSEIDADTYIQRALAVESALIGLYCRIRRKKFIYMVAHDIEVDGKHWLYKNPLSKLLVKLNFKLASQVVAQNDYQMRHLSKFVAKNKLTRLNSSYMIKKQEIKKEDYVLWVGKASPLKQPEIFLKLAQKHKEKHFVMICTASNREPHLLDNVRKKAQRISNLEFIEYVPFSKIDEYFQKAKIFVNTSKQEGFPNTFLQAAANKTPIVSLNVNPNSFLTKYKCGYDCRGELAKMSKSINLLFEKKSLYQQLSENAYQYVKENHDIKSNSQKFIKIIYA